MDTTDDQALLRALQDLPGWERHGNSIQKTYDFDDFGSAALFVSRVADAAAAVGRQPDIAIHGSRVTLELTPNVGGTLTLGDVTLARRIHLAPISNSRSASPAALGRALSRFRSRIRLHSDAEEALRTA